MTHKVRIVTDNNGFFDLDKPDDFVLGVFVTSIRSAGYFLGDTVYIPVDKIVTIFVHDLDNPQAAPLKREGTILQ